MYRLTLVAVIISALFTGVYSQNKFSVSGKVLTGNGDALSYANVLVLKEKDSSMVVGEIAREDGSYKISGIPPGNYLLMASFIGYQTTYSTEFELNSDLNMDDLILIEDQLDEIQIEGTKPLYQQKIDRMVINVENSIISA